MPKKSGGANPRLCSPLPDPLERSPSHCADLGFNEVSRLTPEWAPVTLP
jgi:hypothetical protein